MIHRGLAVFYTYPDDWIDDPATYWYAVRPPDTRDFTDFDVRDLPTPAFAASVAAKGGDRGLHYWQIRVAIEAGLLTAAGLAAAALEGARAAAAAMVEVPEGYQPGYRLEDHIARSLEEKGVTELSLDETIHDIFSSTATSVNNSGLGNQVRAILATLGVKEGMQELRKVGLEGFDDAG